MHPADITAALRKRGTSQAKLAKKLEVRRSAICAVVNARGRSRRIQAAIATATGIPETKLWPKAKRSDQ